MNSNSNKEKNTMTLKEALNKIDSIPPDNKNASRDFLKLYNEYQEQKGIKPDDLTLLLSKGVESLSESKFKILINVYADLKSKSHSNIYVESFIMRECIDYMNSIGYNLSNDTIENEFDILLHKKNSEAESIETFIKEYLVKIKENKTIGKNFYEIFFIVYIFLAVMIENKYKIDLKRNEMLLIMEQAIVEEIVKITDKNIRSSICHDIPQYLAKRKVEKPFSSMSYLYYDYKEKNKILNAEVKKHQDSIAYLNNMLKQKNEKITNLEFDLEAINEENEKLKAQIQAITAEKEEAEDRLEFEKNRIERQYKSQNQGLAKEFNSTIGLEIDGVEDILEFASDDLKNAIQERLDRMRKIIAEMGGK